METKPSKGEPASRTMSPSGVTVLETMTSENPLGRRMYTWTMEGMVSRGFGLDSRRNRPVASVDEEGRMTFLNYRRYTDVLFDVFVLIDNKFRFMWEGCSS